MSAPSREADVVIVGCGPVGAALAIMLQDRGLHAVVVERHRTMYHLPRAIMLGDDVRRNFQHHGMEQHLQSMLTPMYGAEFVDADGHRLLGFDLPEGFVGPLGYPVSNMFHQPDLDQLLRTVARERGATIRLGASCTGIEQAGDHVVAVLDDSTVVVGRWLVGCDGAASAVRSLCGIDTIDLGFDQEWLVVDIDAWGQQHRTLPSIAQQVCDPGRPATFVPGHAHHLRWEFQMQPGETAEEMEQPQRVWELVAPWMSPTQGSLIRAVVYRFHAMVAERMRDGRVLLAGDAAHQMPPFLGQGLNSGFRDATNLAWKLAAVAEGWAGDELLDTYGVERLPHARAVVEHAADVGRLIDQLAGREAHDVDESSGYGGGRPFPRLEAGAIVGRAPMVGRPLPQLVDDGRLSDDELGDPFSVIVGDAAMAVPPALASVVSEVVVDGRLVGDNAAVIVRPDLIVAAVADDQAGLDDAATTLAASLALV